MRNVSESKEKEQEGVLRKCFKNERGCFHCVVEKGMSSTYNTMKITPLVHLRLTSVNTEVCDA